MEEHKRTKSCMAHRSLRTGSKRKRNKQQMGTGDENRGITIWWESTDLNFEQSHCSK